MIRFIVFTLSRLDAQARSITGNVGSAAGFPAGDEFNFGASHQERRRLPSGILVPGRAAIDFPVPIFVRRIEGNTQLYCFAAGGFASGIGGAVDSTGDVVPRSSDAAAQSPAQSLVPLTGPTSLHPIGAAGFACFSLPLVLGVTA
jgi:hypothetical protein